MQITAISGSLRKDSYNTWLLRSLSQLGVYQGVSIEVLTLNDIPFFSEDTESNSVPVPVTQLAQRIVKSDALIIATPEYNGITSGAIINMLEWMSRDSAGKPLMHKPVGIVGATTGGFGTVCAQSFLKSLTLHLDMLPMNKPKVRVSYADKKFDKDGVLIDPAIKTELTEFIAKLKVWHGQMVRN